MIYLVSILGYGDSLITLSLLERAGDAAAGIQVFGTTVTATVAGLLRRPLVPAELIFNDVAAFYVMKERGIAAAARDLVHFRRWTRGLAADDTVIFEKPGWRRHLLVAGRRCSVVEVPRRTSVYIDRETVLRRWLGPQAWAQCTVPRTPAKRLLINPSARHHSRTLGAFIVVEALRQAADAGVEVCLVDVDGSFARFRDQVQTYLRAPPLVEAAAALRECDRYLGPDSFFMHLAYYYGVPQLALFHQHDTYFAPPGLLQADDHLYFSDAADPVHLRAALQRLLGGASIVIGSAAD